MANVNPASLCKNPSGADPINRRLERAKVCNVRTFNRQPLPFSTWGVRQAGHVVSRPIRPPVIGIEQGQGAGTGAAEESRRSAAVGKRLEPDPSAVYGGWSASLSLGYRLDSARHPDIVELAVLRQP